MVTIVLLLVLISTMQLEIQIETQFLSSKQDTKNETFEKIASIYTICVKLNLPKFFDNQPA